MTSDIPAEAAHFKDVSSDHLSRTDSNPSGYNSHNGEILKMEIRDKKHKLWFRIIVSPVLIALLLVQNYLICVFVFHAYHDGRLEQLGTILSIVCTATLAETAAIVHTMVKWVFSDMEYKLR